METLGRLRDDAKQIFMEGVKAVDPYRAVYKAVQDLEHEIGYEEDQGIYIVGAGKATAPMVKAVEDVFDDRIKSGIINVKYGFSEELKYTEVIEAGHPLPDKNGLKGVKKIVGLLNSLGKDDLVFSLISGGGSALLPFPAGNITLKEKQALTQYLLDCGASIDEINIIRKHISLSKGGQMAKAAFPAKVVNLMLSDVVGDRMDIIASGPFVPDPSTFCDAWDILKKYDLLGKLPKSILEHIKEGMDGKVSETPKPWDKVFDRVINRIVASNMIALRACEKKAKDLGYNTLVLSSMIEGETRDVARVHCAIAKEVAKTGNPVKAPACLISGGETTVTIRGKGLGGRNQEFCLASAIDISGMQADVVMLSGGTDGNDGPTDAAGGVVDPMTVERGKDKGMDAKIYLSNNDSYYFLKETGDLLVTGPTRTNVMDIHIILIC